MTGVLHAFLGTRWRAWRLRTRADVLAWQDRAAARLLARIAPSSPHTAARIGGPWREIPAIDKAEMMRAFDALVTVPLRRDEAMATALASEESRDFTPTIGDLTVGLSSGTSGRRALFVASPAEREAWAGTILAKLLPDAILRKHRVAFFLRANSRLYETLGSRRLAFRFFDLQRPLDAHIREIEALDPTILVAPPSVLRALADRGTRARPRRVLSVAEVLDEVDRRRISAHFGVPVEQIYQATEGLLGTSCRHGVLHLAEDVTAFDLESADPSDPGGPRVIPVVTNLLRYAQPIVRYRLDDVLTLRRDPCPCGSPFLAVDAVDGRRDDVLRGSGPAGDVPIFGDLVSRAVLTSLDVADYEVRQDASGIDVDVALDGRAATSAELERVRSALAGLFTRQGASIPDIRVRDGLVAPAPGVVKRRRVRCLVNSAGAAPAAR